MEDLLASLARWSCDLAQRGNEELRRVCHQPKRGTCAYLHILFPGLSNVDATEIESIIEHSLPPKLRAFYAATNGAWLFEGIVSASGLVRNFTRDPAVWNPVSIEHHNDVFRCVRPDWYRRGYFRFGGVSLMRQDELICGPDDSVVVLNGDTGQPLRHFKDVFACFTTLADEMGSFWSDDGAFMGDGAMLDQLILAPTGAA